MRLNADWTPPPPNPSSTLRDIHPNSPYSSFSPLTDPLVLESTIPPANLHCWGCALVKQLQQMPSQRTGPRNSRAKRPSHPSSSGIAAYHSWDP